ncbi:hypothetical protein NUACC26_019210 [Scytonema sp. NUACC26]
MTAKPKLPKLAPWLNFAIKCGYINAEAGLELSARYNQVLSGLVNMINNPSPWLINRST